MVRIEPRYLDAPGGRLFCLDVMPAGPARGYVFHLPAFAEEMNKSRRMVSLAARALADAGWHVFIVDPLGSGDSEGDFGDASLASWVTDAAWCRQQLPAADLPWVWWGLRSGALLASQASQQAGGDALLLWQPVSAGKLFLTQFLRMRLATESLAGGGAADTKPLRAMLDAGESLEVGGYMLSPAMARELELAELKPAAGLPLCWLEISAREEPELLPASRQRVDALRAAGHDVQASAHNGPMFWQSLEISEVPALVDASVAALASLSLAEAVDGVVA
ncbi:MAG: hydrolase 2, exosortase A system-associated [Moraxellaceae bacterium]|nr:hydrolase 2, exosortase A system-associated [Moraxellaceae bacterium]